MNQKYKCGECETMISSAEVLDHYRDNHPLTIEEREALSIKWWNRMFGENRE